MSVESVKNEYSKTELQKIAQQKASNVLDAKSATEEFDVSALEGITAVVEEMVEGVNEAMEKTSETVDTKFVKADERVVASEYDTVNSAMAWGIKVADDDSHGYSMGSDRWGDPNYDCSSLVISAYEAAGLPVRENGAGNTQTMRDAFLATGEFEWIPGPIDTSSLQPGDLLLNEANHVEMYVGNGNTLGAHDDFDGGVGDSAGNEINIAPLEMSWWYPDGILRYTGPQS